VLAFVFSHWQQAGVAAHDYESRQRAFHAALAAAPAPGYRSSFCSAIVGAPWAAEGGGAYEDWYWVDDFTALGELNAAAVSASRAPSHDAVATLSAGGAGAVYGLRSGAALPSPRHAYWFGKPADLSYLELFEELKAHVEKSGGALWMRQMVLGPSREFCLHTIEPISLPASLDVLAIKLRPIWPNA
jgi:hypothetical protein